MMTPPYLQLAFAATPEIVVLLTAIVVLVVDLSLRQKNLDLRVRIAAGLGCVGSTVALALLLRSNLDARLFDGMFVMNILVSHVQIAIISLTILTLLLSTASRRFTGHVGEYVLLVLLATTGMMFLVASRDLLVTFISLELLSLALYALTAFDKQSAKSAEAGLKYFLFGGTSAAFMLFGFSLVYGLTNATGYDAVAVALGRTGWSPVVIAALIMSITGFGFKIAAVPFHFWAPDAYQGAPTPVTGLIATGSKVASFFALFILMTTAFPRVAGSASFSHPAVGWGAVLAVMAAASMIVGNLGALSQRSLRRLMAYSAISHAGYMLIAVVGHTQQSLSALLYYVVTYSLSVLGVFVICAALERSTGGDDIDKLQGLKQSSPVLATGLFVFLLSQAGIPPLAGFFAKFYLFSSALQDTNSLGLLWLVVLAVAMSAVSLYYYLRVLKAALVRESDPHSPAISISPVGTVIIAVLTAAVLLAGCWPEPLIHWFKG